MIEIGSEFWEVETGIHKNKLFPKKAKWFISGQNALNYIIKDIKEKYNVSSVAIPSWCCESMIIPFSMNGFKIEFYPVTVKNNQISQEICSKSDVILVIDYFGYTSDCDFSSYPGIVVRDLTHSLFSKNYCDADYFFGSLRKWTGIYTGGYAWCKTDWVENIIVNKTDNEYVTKRKKAMFLKKQYINGGDSDKEFLNIFREAEERLDYDNGYAIYGAFPLDIDNAKKLDINLIKSRRRANAQRLLSQISNMAVFPYLHENDCPLFVPIVTPKRDELIKYLIENKIYCPIHWPISVYHKLNKETIKLYNEEISIVCDQRYTVEDMDRICKVIEKWKTT